MTASARKTPASQRLSAVAIRPAAAADIEPAAAFLHRHMNAKVPPERWRSILDYPWRPPEVERGWLVEDAGEIVGFMGTIFSDRTVGGRAHRFCDLSSWYLLRDYRASGIGGELLRAGTAEPATTYQTMTARRATGRRIRALGFGVLDATRSLFRPRPGAGVLAIEQGEDAVRQRLGPADRAILDDHRGLDVHHAFVEEFGLWLVYQVKLKGEAVAYHEILHAGDIGALSANAQRIADALAARRDPRRAVLAIDTRFMTPGDDPGFVEDVALARWYRPRGDVQARDVDHLYSEVLLLDQKLP